jgi:hypothetical protein
MAATLSRRLEQAQARLLEARLKTRESTIQAYVGLVGSYERARQVVAEVITLTDSLPQDGAGRVDMGPVADLLARRLGLDRAELLREMETMIAERENRGSGGRG